MKPFETRPLYAALRDTSPWVRLGAAASALYLEPPDAAEILLARAADLGDPLPLDEASTLAVALAGAGEDATPLVAQLLQTSVESVREAVASSSTTCGPPWVQPRRIRGIDSR